MSYTVDCQTQISINTGIVGGPVNCPKLAAAAWPEIPYIASQTFTAIPVSGTATIDACNCFSSGAPFNIWQWRHHAGPGLLQQRCDHHGDGMTWEEALETVVGRTKHERYRALCATTIPTINTIGPA